MEAATAQAAPKPEAKAPGKGEEDLSMEEILQSIRKIIADDDPAAKDAAGGANAAGTPGSDVLELTEIIEEDPKMADVKDTAVKTPEPAKPVETPPADVLNTIDQALAAEKKPEPAPPKPPEKAAVTTAEKPPAPAAAAAAATPATPPAADALLSTEAESAAGTSIKKLRSAEPPPPQAVSTPAPVFRSGGTVEDMVDAMLNPMLKEWLDKNLPGIVERIVEREVRRLTKYLTEDR